jgi:hypothetical protein
VGTQQRYFCNGHLWNGWAEKESAVIKAVSLYCKIPPGVLLPNLIGVGGKGGASKHDALGESTGPGALQHAHNCIKWFRRNGH